MATLVLSAVGAAAGASLGGGVLGLSSVVIGRAVGATVGRLIDQRIMGSGSATVETGRVDQFRLSGASEGAPIKRVYASQRIGGQIIWASQFFESSTTTGGGKSTGGQTTTQYSYSVSLAVGLCEGPITRVGRIWADGLEVSRETLNMRVYKGTEDQIADAKIEAIEGAGEVPAYRGLAYVVFEDLELEQFGNRVPQFSFEVIRGQPDSLPDQSDLATSVRAVALVPGTGEYALATTPLHYDDGLGASRTANVHTSGGRTDFEVSVEALSEELPKCGATSLVVSWFGNDLRCGSCQIEPKVEQNTQDAIGMAWRAGGLTRSQADVIAKIDGRPVYGGTPADASVIEAISQMKDQGLDVMFYPFVLMDQLINNGLEDPWTGDVSQPELPWRGRITTSLAPGRPGTPDKTAAAATEVDAFFGTASGNDFAVQNGVVTYSGPAEFSYRRFILHYAHLCAAAGGVDAFCVGSELRGLTQIRSSESDFPAVQHLRQLAQDVRAILGPETKISYAADWSEYFGYHPQDGSGDVYFHLDPFWSDPNVDFIGIDNYMPLSDWRGVAGEADAAFGSIYNLEYLQSNIAGGEGYDWYYHAPEAAEIQLRTPIVDGAYGEDWVFRYKDLEGWWGQAHFNRPGGVRAGTSTDWTPASKPIWFTELGAAAIDKASNEPNKFYDPKSSESAIPKYSNGQRDDLIQMQFIRAHATYWAQGENNPTSPLYEGPMVDVAKTFIWAWDARPYPAFPSQSNVWSDAANYDFGHWLNGRSTARSLASVVSEICEKADFGAYDVEHLYGLVRGFGADRIATAREEIQPLMLAYGFDASEQGDRIAFANRPSQHHVNVDPEQVAVLEETDGTIQRIRLEQAEVSGRVRLTYIQADGNYTSGSVEAVLPDQVSHGIAQTEFPIALTQAEAQAVVERWLTEARVGRDKIQLALPPSVGEIHPAFEINLEEGETYRIDRITRGQAIMLEGTRIEKSVYVPSDAVTTELSSELYIPPLPVHPVFLDLPLILGDEDPVAPALAVAADPWPGRVAVYSSSTGTDFERVVEVSEPAVIGETLTSLSRAAPYRWDRGAPLRVKVSSGALSSAETDSILAGANLAALGSPGSQDWEVFQFASAVLVDENTFDLSMRLRGQYGTESQIQQEWPTGTRFVLLNGALAEVPLNANLRGLALYYRIGSAARPYDDASYVTRQVAFDGIGLRPYAPSHMRASVQSNGDLAISWVRRTRFEGDQWGATEPPLNEAYEAYLVRVFAGGSLLREVTVPASQWTYSAAEQASDALAGEITISIAQISDRFGPGAFGEVQINV